MDTTARTRIPPAALISLALAIPPLTPLSPASAAPAATFSSCAKVQQKSSGGIAESKAAAARVKGKQVVSAGLYKKYRKWDRNKGRRGVRPTDSKPKTVTVSGTGTLFCPDGMEFVGASAAVAPPASLSRDGGSLAGGGVASRGVG